MNGPAHTFSILYLARSTIGEEVNQVVTINNNNVLVVYHNEGDILLIDSHKDRNVILGKNYIIINDRTQKKSTEPTSAREAKSS